MHSPGRPLIPTWFLAVTFDLLQPTFIASRDSPWFLGGGLIRIRKSTPDVVVLWIHWCDIHNIYRLGAAPALCNYARKIISARILYLRVNARTSVTVSKSLVKIGSLSSRRIATATLLPPYDRRMIRTRILRLLKNSNGNGPRMCGRSCFP